MIENFCLGTRRLELFGKPRNCRPGWLTIGKEEMVRAGESVPNVRSAQAETTNTQKMKAEIYDKEAFDSYFLTELRKTGANLVPTTAEVEDLRPRSPGGANKASNPPVPGLKTNPQGIGRHTNRAATPSASQALEYERLQAQFQEQFVRQQQQQQMLEFERQRQEEMLRQQALMMQQMAMMGMPAAMQGMPMGMNGFAPGFQPNQMFQNGQAGWQMPMDQYGALLQGQYQNFNNGSQQQYQQQQPYPAQEGQFHSDVQGGFSGYNTGF